MRVLRRIDVLDSIRALLTPSRGSERKQSGLSTASKTRGSAHEHRGEERFASIKLRNWNQAIDRILHVVVLYLSIPRSAFHQVPRHEYKSSIKPPSTNTKISRKDLQISTHIYDRFASVVERSPPPL